LLQCSGFVAVIERRAAGLQVRMCGSPALVCLVGYRPTGAVWMRLQRVSDAKGG
jgi:hypothetical protein